MQVNISSLAFHGRGFVTTPDATVDLMVDLLFRGRPPSARSELLDPGCGTGAFIAGVLRWCRRHDATPPRMTGIESDPRHLPVLRERFGAFPNVKIIHADFLEYNGNAYDYIVGNPPYVPITEISMLERERFRRRFSTARGRFDLYLLFFEQAVERLRSHGRLAFITPEKFLYTETATPLRKMLTGLEVEEIRLLPENTFGSLITYPTVTVVHKGQPSCTRVIRRDGARLRVRLPSHGESWLSCIQGALTFQGAGVLEDACIRISCGVATGADGVFVRPNGDLDAGLKSFAYPTLSGRDLSFKIDHIPLPRYSMLVPYDEKGELLPLERLGSLRRYLERSDIQRRLRARYCTRQNKPWYAFHETPRLPDILRPKILCKDIGERPRFWTDKRGCIVPRHSLYYLVPKRPEWLFPLVKHLQSEAVREWLENHCQRAAKGFIRLQSNNLRQVPLPKDWESQLRADQPATDTLRSTAIGVG